MPRVSASLSPTVYETLEEIAREKKVSLSWVIRDAAEKYIADRWPLFGKSLTEGNPHK
jgi:metal-responsive CopG/Arc/MetJ family transcriptional regulator